jgi:S-DNA-T family DNA segregation ATPase FtsK/SpoIIIE
MTWTEGQQYVVVTSRPRLRAAQLTALDRSVELVELVESVAMAGTNRSGKLALLELVDVGRLSTEPLQVSSDGAAQVFIGDVEDWQSQFTLLTRIRPHATFVFDDCSPAEVRAVRRSRDVLPHVNRGSAISVDLEGEATRVRLI